MSKSSDHRRPATHGLARILEDEDVTSFADVSEALRKQREREREDDQEDAE